MEGAILCQPSLTLRHAFFTSPGHCMHGVLSSSKLGMVVPSYLILTAQDHLTWPSSQMPLVPLVMLYTMLATGLLNPCQPSSRTAPFSGKGFTPLLLPASYRSTCGLERRFTSTATISLLSTSWLLVPLLTLISRTLFTPYIFVALLTILQS